MSIVNCVYGVKWVSDTNERGEMTTIQYDLVPYRVVRKKNVVRIEGVGRSFPQLSREYVEQAAHYPEKHTGIDTSYGFVEIYTEGDDLVIEYYCGRGYLREYAVIKLCIEVLETIDKKYDSIGWEMLNDADYFEKQKRRIDDFFDKQRAEQRKMEAYYASIARLKG